MKGAPSDDVKQVYDSLAQAVRTINYLVTKKHSPPTQWAGRVAKPLVESSVLGAGRGFCNDEITNATAGRNIVSLPKSL